MSPVQPRHRILVIAPNWIGDALMSLPLLARLKDETPAVHITVLAPTAVSQVLGCSPLVDQVITTTWGHGGLQLMPRYTLARQLAREQFDVAVVLPNSLKSALIPLFAGIVRRVGYLGELRRGVLTRTLPNPDRSMPMVDRYQALAVLAGHTGSASDETANPIQPTLRVAQAQIVETLTRFGLDPSRPLVVFCPGAEYGPAKRWPESHFARLAELIHERYSDTQIVLAGAAGDAMACAAIAQAATTEVLSTAGQTSVSDALALLADADLVVSNDSGLMHVAAALGRPLVALYGSTDPRHTPPQSLHAAILWLHLSCSPCFARVCPLGHFRCLIDLTPESVLAAIPSGALH